MFAGLFLASSVFAQSTVKDYLSVSGPLLFDSVSYNLSWSAHPSDNYFKHEYLPKSADAEKFKQMILLEFIGGDFKPKDAVDAKVSELKELKKTNPVVNYDVMENKQNGEYILDFLVSENTPDGQHIAVVERNVYRFKKAEDASGRAGVVLFAVSSRAYGDDITRFLVALKTNRNEMIKAVAAYPIPDIKIVN